MLKNIILTAVMAFILATGLLVSCGGNKSEKAVKKYEALAVSACNCTTTECAKKTLVSFKAITIEFKDARFDNMQKLRMAEAGQKFVTCIMRNGININDFKELEKDLKENGN